MASGIPKAVLLDRGKNWIVKLAKEKVRFQMNEETKRYFIVGLFITGGILGGTFFLVF